MDLLPSSHRIHKFSFASLFECCFFLMPPYPCSAIKTIFEILGNQIGGDEQEYSIVPTGNNTVPYPTIPGPLLRDWAYTWLPDENLTAPIQQSNFTTLICPNDVEAVEGFPPCVCGIVGCALGCK